MNRFHTFEKKLEIVNISFPKESKILSIENQKLMCLTIYNHLIAIQGYNISSLPRLKSPITLLKPTLPLGTFIEEDYGLHKVNLIWIEILK